MPANTYTLIEKIVVGAAGAATIDFTSIPQTYTDLYLLLSLRQSNSGGSNVSMTFNNSTTGYTNRDLIVAGTSVVSESSVLGTSAIKIGFITSPDYTASTFGNTLVYIPNYAGSNNKSVSTDEAMENNASSVYFGFFSGLWSNSSAITSIKLTPEAGSFVQYSSAYLYGIAKEGVTPSPSSAPYATGGDRILFDGTYWYHVFTSTGTFTPNKGLTCDYLVVAGGGGGGSLGGGGGAGGLRSTVTATGGGGSLESAVSFTNGTAYTVTVGAGGTGSPADTLNGTSGSNSSISGTGLTTITSTGGGRGGNNGGALTGGSGGGGGNSSPGAAGTANQGYAGGGVSPGNSAGSGGGGAGSVGANANTGTNAIGGNGGSGVNVSITGSSVAYAGGGGGSGRNDGGGSTAGGTASAGGGAGGASNSAGSAGTANTGGGGGGGGYNGTFYSGGNGGSGIVIVRYAA